MGFWKKLRRQLFGREARKRYLLDLLEDEVFPKIRAKAPGEAEAIIKIIRQAVQDL